MHISIINVKIFLYMHQLIVKISISYFHNNDNFYY